MFSKIIDKIAFQNFDNYGVVFEKDGKYFSENTLNEVGIEDNKGNYFFAIKSEIDFEQIGCAIKRLTQNYTFKFVTHKKSTNVILNNLMSLVLQDVDPISNTEFTLSTFFEEYVKENLLTNTFEIEFRGDLNDCAIDVSCEC